MNLDGELKRVESPIPLPFDRHEKEGTRQRLIIMANTRKFGGHCLAAWSLDEHRWMRLGLDPPLNPDDHSWFDNDTLAILCGDPEGPKIGSLFEIPILCHHPKRHHPEDVLIPHDKWVDLGIPTQEQMDSIAVEERSTIIKFGADRYDRIPCDSYDELSIGHSLELVQLIHPLTVYIDWRRSTNRVRTKFQYGHLHYNFAATDIRFQSLLRKKVGKELVFKDPKILVGLSEPFSPAGHTYLYKLVLTIM